MKKNYRTHYDVSDVFDYPRLSRGFVERDYSIGSHTQGFYEVNIVLEGEATHTIGERKMTVCAGDTFIIPPLVPHSYEGGEGFDVYHLILSPKYLERHASSLSLLPAFSALFRVEPMMREKTAARLHFTLNTEEIASILPTLYSLAERDTKSDSANAVIGDGEALIIIAVLCSLYEQKTPSIAPANEDSAFAESIAYIYEHYNEVITVEQLCRIAKMSRTAFLSKFKTVTGKSPISLQASYRVQVAKQLLTQTNAPITEISQTVGCYDTSHFIRLFKKKTGLTPSCYRKSGGKKD